MESHFWGKKTGNSTFECFAGFLVCGVGLKRKEKKRKEKKADELYAWQSDTGEGGREVAVGGSLGFSGRYSDPNDKVDT